MNYGEFLKREFSEETPELTAAKKEYPLECWVFLTETNQFGTITDHKNSPDGILVQVGQIGLVPIKEIRKATEEEIQNYKKS